MCFVQHSTNVIFYGLGLHMIKSDWVFNMHDSYVDGLILRHYHAQQLSNSVLISRIHWNLQNTLLKFVEYLYVCTIKQSPLS